MNLEKNVDGFTYCYRITYIDRDGWRRVRTYHAKSRDEAIVKASEDGIADDIVHIRKSDLCLACKLSKLLHRHRA